MSGEHMAILKPIILGLVQGLTEFLPVSSSGHLVLGTELLGFRNGGLFFDVFLHFGTFIALVVFFHRDILAMVRSFFQRFFRPDDPVVRKFFALDLQIICATIPAVIVGLFFKDQVEHLFSSPGLVLPMLALTGVMMVATRFLPARHLSIGMFQAVAIGCAQAVSITPGISRSGATIFIALLLGAGRDDAARFSFLLAVPALAGAFILSIADLPHTFDFHAQWLGLALGTFMSFVSGLFAIYWLLGFVRRGWLHWFGIYCLAVSLAGIVYSTV